MDLTFVFYPHWPMATSDDSFPGLSEDQRRGVYGATAAERYGVTAPTPA